MTTSGKPPPLWLATLYPQVEKHERWYRGNRTGPGRIELKGENLRDAKVVGLQAARFEDCDFTCSRVEFFDEAELIACTFDESLLTRTSFRQATLLRTNFRGAWLGHAKFDDAVITGGDWLGAYLERGQFSNAIIRDVSFRASKLVDARLDGATFVNCSFRHADLSRLRYEFSLATCYGTRFVDCEFRGANLDGLRFDNTVFERCSFAEMRGKPNLKGPCTLIEPDYSIAPQRPRELRDADTVLELWRTRDRQYIDLWSERGKHMEVTIEP